MISRPPGAKGHRSATPPRGEFRLPFWPNVRSPIIAKSTGGVAFRPAASGERFIGLLQTGRNSLSGGGVKVALGWGPLLLPGQRGGTVYRQKNNGRVSLPGEPEKRVAGAAGICTLRGIGPGLQPIHAFW